MSLDDSGRLYPRTQNVLLIRDIISLRKTLDGIQIARWKGIIRPTNGPSEIIINNYYLLLRRVVELVLSRPVETFLDAVVLPKAHHARTQLHRHLAIFQRRRQLFVAF